MKTRTLCAVGLILFVISYIMFSQGALRVQKPIDFAHWFNLIGAALLFSFNSEFIKKNKLHTIASFLTTIIDLHSVSFSLISQNEFKSYRLQFVIK